jgi:DNA-binding response OmpR family regulator
MPEPKIRLLIAERNPRMRDFLRREFSRRNFIVDGAASGDELLTKLESGEHVHLIVLAANTPEGWKGDLPHQLGRNHPHIPVILYAYLEDFNHSVSPAAYAAMVEKNGNPENLARMVIRILHRHYPDFMLKEGEKDGCVS